MINRSLANQLLEDLEVTADEVNQMVAALPDHVKNKLRGGQEADIDSPYGSTVEYNTVADVDADYLGNLPSTGLGKTPKNINKDRYKLITDRTKTEIAKLTDINTHYYVAIGIPELAKTIVLNKLLVKTINNYIEFIDWTHIDDILRLPSIIVVLDRAYIDNYFTVYDVNDTYVDIQFTYATNVVKNDIHPVNEYITDIIVIRNRNLIVIDENGNKTMVDPKLIRVMLDEDPKFRHIPVHIINAEDIVDGVDTNVISKFRHLKQILGMPSNQATTTLISRPRSRLLGYPSVVTSVTPVGYGYNSPILPTNYVVDVPVRYHEVPPPPPSSSMITYNNYTLPNPPAPVINNQPNPNYVNFSTDGPTNPIRVDPNYVEGEQSLANKVMNNLPADTNNTDLNNQQNNINNTSI